MTTKIAQVKNPYMTIIDTFCSRCGQAIGVRPDQVKSSNRCYCPACINAQKKTNKVLFGRAGMFPRVCDLPE